MENKKMIDILSTLYQKPLYTLIDIGFLADTDYFDEILKDKDNYNFEFSKIYNKEYYEIILDTNFEVKRMMRPLIQNVKLDSGIDIEEIEDMDEMDDTTQVSNEYLIQDENYIYEISPISDEMVALIIETIVNSENKYYIRNLREFLFFRNYNQKEKVKNTKISDLILYNFKREFMTLKIKTSQKLNTVSLMN